nr:tethering factor for nuclear proteasome sts1 [Quercus suber]
MVGDERHRMKDRAAGFRKLAAIHGRRVTMVTCRTMLSNGTCLYVGCDRVSDLMFRSTATTYQLPWKFRAGTITIATLSTTTTIMSQLLHAPSAPHLLFERLSPPRQNYATSAMSSGRKRKASEEPDHDRMSTSPSASPSVATRGLPSSSSSTHRSIKRTRTHNAAGRPLPLSRLLQTLSADELRQALQSICVERPEIQQAIVTRAPRPSIESTLDVLDRYETSFRQAFPLGNNLTSDYAYNRVQQTLVELLEALRDFTPYYLPPQETQAMTSLSYLDTVTNMLHRIPNWETYQYQRHKNESYEDIAKAWALVIKETSKRAGGFQLQFGGWDTKLVEHNEKSGGRLEEAVNELKSALGFMNHGTPSTVPGVSEERASIRQQLFAGTYGQELDFCTQGASLVRWVTPSPVRLLEIMDLYMGCDRGQDGRRKAIREDIQCSDCS